MHGKKHWNRERSHMRFVIDIVGRPLTHFRTTKEMIMALRDAIKGNVDTCLLCSPLINHCSQVIASP